MYWLKRCHFTQFVSKFYILANLASRKPPNLVFELKLENITPRLELEFEFTLVELISGLFKLSLFSNSNKLNLNSTLSLTPISIFLYDSVYSLKIH